MTEQQVLNFNRVANAIQFLNEHFQKQPSLAELAQAVHVSPFHFQRLFSKWAGVSPKKFLQYLTVTHAKVQLANTSTTLQLASENLGLSGSSRLHDLFINIERMTPGEYKSGGASLTIEYSFALTSFGKICIASTSKGICSLTFCEDTTDALVAIRSKFPNASFCARVADVHKSVLSFFNALPGLAGNITLHLHGTDFEMKVWEALLTIPTGKLCSYANIARAVGNANASRAVGTAIGHNPIAYIIPCHRVIQATGNFGGYRWGAQRKSAIIGWEAAQSEMLHS